MTRRGITGDVTVSRHDRHTQMARGGDQQTIGRITVKWRGQMCAVDRDIGCERGLPDRRDGEKTGEPRLRIGQEADGVRVSRPAEQADFPGGNGRDVNAVREPRRAIASIAGSAIGSPFAR